MVRFLMNKFPGLLRDDAAERAAPPAPAAETAPLAAEPAPRSDVAAFHESQREWEAWWAQHKHNGDEGA
jgi:hypothetical protein